MTSKNVEKVMEEVSKLSIGELISKDKIKEILLSGSVWELVEPYIIEALERMEQLKDEEFSSCDEECQELQKRGEKIQELKVELQELKMKDLTADEKAEIKGYNKALEELIEWIETYHDNLTGRIIHEHVKQELQKLKKDMPKYKISGSYKKKKRETHDNE